MAKHLTSARLIAESDALLLDFDGPICNVYAGSDPCEIARAVAEVANLGIELTCDPLDVLRCATSANGQVDAAHAALTELEVEAMATATETIGVRNVVETYPNSIAIVSNNASEAIHHWLRAARLDDLIEIVVGRDPVRMKPDPAPLVQAARAVGAEVRRCVFVGDSLSDAEAADAIDMPMIALANKPHKRQVFERHGCSPIIESMLAIGT